MKCLNIVTRDGVSKMGVTDLQDTLKRPMDFVFPGVHWFLEIIILLILVLFLWNCICTRSVRYFWKFPAPAFMGRAIAGPHRKRMQPTSMLIKALELTSGMKVLELGCGPGTFTTDVARAIHPDGLVYAVDIQEGMLDQLRSRKLGEPGLLRVHRWRQAETETHILSKSSTAALLFGDIDLALRIFGETPTEIYAIGRDDHAYVQVHLGFSNGGMAILDFARGLPSGQGYNSVSLIGSTGAAYADDHHNSHLLFTGGVVHKQEDALVMERGPVLAL